MADRNSTGAVHLTSIDLDISGVRKNLEEIKNGIDETAKYVRETKFTLGGSDSSGSSNSGSSLGESISQGFEQANKSAQEFSTTVNNLFAELSKGNIDSFLARIGVKEENLDTAREKISLLAKELDEFQVDSLKLDVKNGDLSKAIVDYTQDIGDSYRSTIDLTKELVEVTTESGEKIKSFSESAFKNTIGGNQKEILKEQERQQKELAKLREAEEKEIKRQEEAAWKEYEAFQEAEAKKNAEIEKGVAKRNAEREKEEAAAEKLAQSEKSALAESEKSYHNAIKTLESLSTTYSNIAEKINQSNISSDKKDYFLSGIEKAKISIEELKSDLSKGFFDESASKKAEEGIKRFSKALEQLKHEFSSASKESKEFSSISDNIQKVTTKLSALEKVGKTGGIRKEASELRTEFQNLYNQIQSGSISIDEAKSKFNELGNSFEQLNLKAKTATGGIEGLLLRFADKAKWMVAFQAVNLIQSALGNVVSTIQTTEDAVVDLQRVLTEDISDTGISKELYAIASEFGQTFENVQEVAIRFAQTGMGWQEVVDATRATMLGLNTAELEVTTATEGLIATINQFNIPASELEEVIDKINITADHFPVTSEKIVAALQRAGGTASAFNMTLEETIATITTLSAQTGRSGETIGTVLNSLIIYTSKSKSLELFSGLSEDMDNVVKKFKAGSASIIDVWKQLGVEIDNLSEQQQSALFNSEAFEEFADTFEAEASDYAEAIRKIYGTAGTYRQNYLKVLLEDTENIEKVLENLSNAEGYSLEENKKYMDTLTARWNELVIAAKELAVQFGESGILDFIKLLVSGTTAVLKFAKSIGGLTTALGVLLSVFLKIKGEKIVDIFTSLISTVGSGISSIKNFAFSLVGIETSATGAAAATTALSVSLSGVLSIISLAITAIYALCSAYNEAQKAAKEYREEAIKTGKESEKAAKDMLNAYNDFKDNVSNDSVVGLFESMGYEESDIEVLRNRYGSLEEAIKKVTEAKYEQLKVDALARQQAAHEKFADIEQPYESASISGLKGWKEAYDALKDYNKELGIFEQTSILGNKVIGFNMYALEGLKMSYKDAKENAEILRTAIDILKGSLTEEERANNEVYQSMVKKLKVYEDLIMEADLADTHVEALGSTIEEAAENQRKAAEAAKNYADGLSDADDSMGKATISAEQLKEYIETLSNAFDELSGKVDDFQSAYETVIGVIDEYNETGIMTADMLQKILELEPQYIEMIDVSTDSLGLNEQAVGNLINTNDNYLQQLIALKVAKEADAMASSILAAQNDNVAISEINAANAATTLQAQLQNAVIACINGTGSAQDLADALRRVGQEAGLAGEYLDYFTKQGMNMANTLGSLYGKINRGSIGTYYTPRVSTGSSGRKSGSGSSANNAAKEALQAEIKAWQKQKEAVNDYYKGLEENLKKQKKDSDDYYDGLIENLKKVEESNERINAQLDYYTNRQKLLRNIEQAQARSGVEWREKEADYQQQLVDFDEEWRRKLEDWSIDDRIAELQDMKKLAQDIVDEQIEYIKDLKDNAIKHIEEMIDKLQEKVSALGKSTGSAVANGISSGAGAGIASLGKAWEDYSEKVAEESSKATKTVAKDTKSILDEVKRQQAEIILQMFDAIKRSGDTLGPAFSNTAKQAAFDWAKNFAGPVRLDLQNIEKIMLTNLVNSAQASAKSIKNQYTLNFINPLDRELNNIFLQTANRMSNILKAPAAANKALQNMGISNTNTVNMYNNISTPLYASQAAQRAADFFTNPSKR